MARPELLDLPTVVRDVVPNGTEVYLGNFGTQLFAVGHEFIRAGRRNLHVVCSSGGILLDQLIGAGCVAAATFCHCWNPVGPAPASCFRRVLEAGGSAERFRELSIGWLTAALTAGAWNVPFLPVPELPGTGYQEDDWADGAAAVIATPFGAATIVEAITPDVAFVHADAVTRGGDALIRTPRGETPVAALAAERVVVVAEELVEDAAARTCPTEVAIPGVVVEAIVISPGSAYPDGVPGRYPRDVAAYEAYARAARTETSFEGWLRTIAHEPGPEPWEVHDDPR